MRGRKPKPTAIKVLAGNPGRRPLNLDEPRVVGGAPRCPRDLSKAAKHEWHRVIKALRDSGVLKQTDMAILAAYCSTYALWMQAQAQVEEEGITTVSIKGGLVAHPAVGIARTNAKLLQILSAELGLTPSSRSRLKADPDDRKKKSLAEELFESVEVDQQQTGE